MLPPLLPEEAKALFRERVRAAGIDKELGPAEMDAIPALVSLLDNLPLAIELAAARVPVLGPQNAASAHGRAFQSARQYRTAP
jgi:predicted ATPase